MANLIDLTRLQQALSGAKNYTDTKVKTVADDLASEIGTRTASDTLLKARTTVKAGDQVLAISDTAGISATVGIKLDTTANKIYLLGKDGKQIGTSYVDTSTFIKDSFLSNAEIVAKDGNGADGTFIKLTFTTDNGANLDPIYLNAASFVYTAGDGVGITGNVISAKIKNGETYIGADSEGIYMTPAFATLAETATAGGAAAKELADYKTTNDGALATVRNTANSANTTANSVKNRVDNIDNGKFVMVGATAGSVDANDPYFTVTTDTGKVSVKGKYSSINSSTGSITATDILLFHIPIATEDEVTAMLTGTGGIFAEISGN